MAYSINPYLPKARAIALKLLLIEQLPLSVVADRCGIHRTTVWRWKKKWELLNVNTGQEKGGRPNRQTSFQPGYYRWSILTENAAPHTHPLAIAEALVNQVLTVRQELGRCAEVVWYHVTRVLGLVISLSSVKRIFRRHHVYDRPHGRKRSYHKGLPRPVVTGPGALVQTDTVHLVDLTTMRRIYLYTVIDLYTRLAYVVVASRILPGIAARVVLEAQVAFGFSFTMVQSDNGPEYSSYFEERLHGNGIATRHSRLHRPNDNAHIERFNRTIQEECTGRYWNRAVPLARLQEKITSYLDYYNTRRVHLGIQLRTPISMLQR